LAEGALELCGISLEVVVGIDAPEAGTTEGSGRNVFGEIISRSEEEAEEPSGDATGVLPVTVSATDASSKRASAPDFGATDGSAKIVSAPEVSTSTISVST
jgi:hypothetical protein